MAAAGGRGEILPAHTPAPAPWAPGRGHGSGFDPGVWFWVHKRGCSVVSQASATPSHASHGPWPGAAPELTPPSPPAHCHAASETPAVPPLPSKAANSRSGNPATPTGVSRPAHGRFPPPAATTRQAPLTSKARSGLAFPPAMAVEPLPSSDALLLLLLFCARPPLQPLLQKTLTSTGGEQSQPRQLGNRGLPTSYPFSWLCCFSTKKKS